jgi:hypothetical protein
LVEGDESEARLSLSNVSFWSNDGQDGMSAAEFGDANGW